jgi:RNA-binding protein YhbY
MNNTQQRLNEIEAQEKQLAEEKVKLLEASKDADLELVKKLCKQHGFTATQLRGCLASRGRKKKNDGTSDVKPAAKKTAAKKTTKVN